MFNRGRHALPIIYYNDTVLRDPYSTITSIAPLQYSCSSSLSLNDRVLYSLRADFSSLHLRPPVSLVSLTTPYVHNAFLTTTLPRGSPRLRESSRSASVLYAAVGPRTSLSLSRSVFFTFLPPPLPPRRSVSVLSPLIFYRPYLSAARRNDFRAE